MSYDFVLGDKVVRMLAGKIPVELMVVDTTETKLICGLRPDNPDREAYQNPVWVFDRATGVEIDDDIPVIVSYLLPKSHNHRTNDP